MTRSQSAHNLALIGFGVPSIIIMLKSVRNILTGTGRRICTKPFRNFAGVKV